jgi:hypothetical protein
MIPGEFHRRIQTYVVNAGIDMSVLRSAPAGTKDAAHKFLFALDLGEFTADPASFPVVLNEKTEALKDSFPENGRVWGRARKCLNIFLRNATYSYYLREKYVLGKLESILELPLDSNVARGLKRDAAEYHISPPATWKFTIIGLTPKTNDSWQAIASEVARKRNIHRVHLDLWYWRDEQLRAPSMSRPI